MKLIKSLRRVVQELNSMFWTAHVKKRAKNVGTGLRVNCRSAVTDKTILGDFVNFNGMVIDGGGNVKIGSYFHSGKGCKMITQNHNYDQGKQIPYDETYVYKDVIIDDFVWLGDDVLVLGGTHIGEGAIIQTGSVVCGDIPPCAIAGGHPAKVFKYRDKDHFYRLKQEGKFN